MRQQAQMLSVINIAEICGVARSTVSYWIAEKALPANRIGKKHMISAEDLIIFLESDGRPVPQVLLENIGGIYSRPFRPFQNCWDYWAKDSHGEKCRECRVYNHRLRECFIVKGYQRHLCPIHCSECRYFHEYYGPRMAFIYQMEIPAAIYKDLYLWSGNKAWADLCGVDIEQLIGAGVEEFIHPDSLKIIVNYNKKIQQGVTSGVFRYNVFFETNNGGKIRANLSISPLIRPSGTWLALAEKRAVHTIYPRIR